MLERYGADIERRIGGVVGVDLDNGDHSLGVYERRFERVITRSPLVGGQDLAAVGRERQHLGLAVDCEVDHDEEWICHYVYTS